MKYLCYEDMQNTDFCVGLSMTSKEWGDLAHEWEMLDGNYELTDFTDFEDRDRMAYISHVWSINFKDENGNIINSETIWEEE